MTGSEQASIATLGRRVDLLDDDVKQLRAELEDYRHESERADQDMSSTMSEVANKLDRHLAKDGEQYRDQDRKIVAIQASIDALAEELREPMEVWRTTKYGAKAASLLVSFVRWAVPIGAAALIGYNAWQAKMLTDIRAELPSAVASAAHKGSEE